MENTVQKILIDTDPGQDIDDILAIAFALKRPGQHRRQMLPAGCKGSKVEVVA